MSRLLYVIFSLIALTALLVSCEDEKHYYVKNVGDGESTPTMSTLNVKTMISDSGYTKYYIVAPIWDMYEEAAEAHWNFPEGVEMEQYDNGQNIEATLRCDSAIYYTHKRLWQLDGRVVMVNVNRDSFLTNQVYWDQGYRKIYSDSFVHIVRSDRIIEGYGFESNESMTEYTVTNPTGIFPVENQGKKTVASDTEAESDYEYDEDSRRARAPQRASERNTFSVRPI